MINYRIGHNVTWDSAAGELSGEIVDIVLGLNGAGDIVPWIDVETDRTTIRLCATDLNLRMMKVRHTELEVV